MDVINNDVTNSSSHSSGQQLNIIAQQLQSFFNRHSLLAPAYSKVFHLFNGNELLISCIGTYILMLITFWFTCALFLVVDVTGKPRFIARYKLQQDKNVPVDKEKLMKAVKTAMFNNVILNAVFAYPMYRGQRSAGCSFAIEDTPLWSRVLVDIAVSTAIQEIVFYYSHRLFHMPCIYQLVHRQHHQWTAPVGVVSIYTTPIEYLTGNGLSVFLGPLVCRSHILTWWIWYSLALSVTVIHHSGYHLPGFPSPQFHDYHHLTFNWNYGTLGLLDWLHGTDKQFRRSVQRKRHRTFWKLTPIHEIYPSTAATGLATPGTGPATPGTGTDSQVVGPATPDVATNGQQLNGTNSSMKKKN